MRHPKSWGTSMYDDILKKYHIPKKHLFIIIDTNDLKKVNSKLKKSIKGLNEIRKRHKMLIENYMQRRMDA